MITIKARTRRVTAGAAATSLLTLSLLGATPSATAEVSTDAGVIINEIYGGGGNSRAPLTNDFIELVNTTDTDVELAGWSLQYASAAGTAWNNQVNLDGTIPAGATYLIEAAAGANTDATPLPTPDQVSTLALSATDGNVALVNSTDKLTCQKTDCGADAAVVDLVGFGNGAAFAGSGAAPKPSNTTSIERTDHVNTADNAADFTAGEPTPTNSAGETVGEEPDPEPTDPPTDEPTDPELLEIAQIQGSGPTSPQVDKTVRTRGVVTAAYPTGGINGFVIQTPGTGGDYDPATHDASDAIFIYSRASVEVGNHVEVTGKVAEYYGLTQIVPSDTTAVVVLEEAAQAVKPIETTWPRTDTAREALESMLILPEGDFTVSNTYSTNQYGEVGLASGTQPLIQPTDVAPPGPQTEAIAEDNAARGVVLDDGATTNFLSSANNNQTPPYVSLDNPVRVGAKVNFTEPVIVDYRNDTWKLNPTPQVRPGEETVSFEDTRTDAPDAAALGDGDVRLASFNVLNYFTTLGVDVAGCTSYNDRQGNPITVNRCPDPGPRGAWDAANLARQQAKIVAAINATDAHVTGLMEIENSAALGEPTDHALATLVDALNADAGSAKWAFVPSSTDLPDIALQDVITNAIIYQPGVVTMTGDPVALGDQSGSGQAFVNAREPIGQVFEPADGGENFLVVVNHFKSKGSAGPFPGDEDTGDGQGSSNGSRMRQAAALRDWVEQLESDAAVDSVALIGDFNSYTAEDPLQVLYDAGYVDANTHFETGKFSYSFSGLSGSLDHILLNEAFLDRTTGADIWNINAPESIALEYSRYNSHGTLFYDESPFRASDHDPVIIAFRAGEAHEVTDTSTTLEVTGDAIVGKPLTLIATVTPADAAGTLEFRDGDRLLGSVIVDGTSPGSSGGIVTQALGAGKHSLTATFVPDDTRAFAGSTSKAITVEVKAPPVTKVKPKMSVKVSNFGKKVAVKVSAKGVTPTGDVTVRVDGRVVQSAQLKDGAATLTIPRTGLGLHVYQVTYSGDANVTGTTTALLVLTL